MISEEFQTWKLGMVVGAILLATALEMVLPYQRDWRAVFRNGRTNYALAAFNIVLLAILTRGWLAGISVWAAERELGLMRWLGFATWLQIIASILTLDFLAYGLHVLYHHQKFLWRFHAVHHTDPVLDTSTAFRFHPGEVIVSLVVRTLVVGVVGIPWLGLLVFEGCFALSNTIQHSHTRLPKRVDALVAQLFVTPALHRKHHSQSRADLNSNFGVIFCIWDRLFGTLHHASSEEAIAVGLPEIPVVYSSSWIELLKLPARKS